MFTCIVYIVFVCACVNNIKHTAPTPFFRRFIMLYDFRPSGWKMTIILLQQLAIKRLAENVEWRVKEPQRCTTRIAHRNKHYPSLSVMHTHKHRAMQQTCWTVSGACDKWSFGGFQKNNSQS